MRDLQYDEGLQLHRVDIDMDLSAVTAFISLARELHYGRAAAELNMSASRLTRMIQSLEREVGARLLVRSTHGAELTAAGAEFLASAKRIVAELDWVGLRFSRGSLSSAATFTVGCLAGSLYDALPERVRAARLAYPKLQTRVVEAREDTMARQVLDGTLDMAFVYFPLPDDLLTRRVVARRAQWVAMSLDHPLKNAPTLSIRDLAGQNMILPDEVTAPRLHRWYRSFLEKDGQRAFRYVGANQIHVALGLCAAGEGLCVVAENLMGVRRDDIRYVRLTNAPRTELTAIWRSDSPVRQVAQFIAKW